MSVMTVSSESEWKPSRTVTPSDSKTRAEAWTCAATFCPRARGTVVLNNDTTPPPRLANAVTASLAVPPLFAPVTLDGYGLCTDGGIGDFPGIAGVPTTGTHAATNLPFS